MNLNNLKISRKLFLSFFIVIAIFIGATVYQIIKLQNLSELQDAGAGRAEDALEASKAASLGYRMYQVIADGIINRNLEETEKEWKVIKKEITGDLAKIENKVDTREGKQWISQAKEKNDELVNLFEGKMLPLLKSREAGITGETEEEIREEMEVGITKEISNIDGLIDKKVKELEEPLLKIQELFTEKNKEENAVYDSSQAKLLRASSILLAISVIISITLVSLLSNTITSGIKKGVQLSEKIAGGDLTFNIEKAYLEREDEIGNLSNSLQKMVDKLREIVSNIMVGAESIANASFQLSSTAQEFSQGSTQQASSAEEISSYMEEMVSNIQHTADNALQTEKIAKKAASGIDESNKSAEISVVSMKDIAEKIKIINDIAFQTNILALNAAVEAARAGEHGRGFAVVADEVRKLAERSKIAADEIDELSCTGVEVSEKAGIQLAEIVPEIENTAKLIQEIAAASMEQNSGADQVNNAIQQLNKVTQQNAAASEELSTSSEELSSQADQLKVIISFFKLDGTIHVSRKKAQSKTWKEKLTSQNEGRQKENVQGVDLRIYDSEPHDDEYERFK